MKVLHTTDLSRAGNDCYISESVSLVEALGMYVVIVAERTTGWLEREMINPISKIVYDLEEAKEIYKVCGGVMENETLD